MNSREDVQKDLINAANVLYAKKITQDDLSKKYNQAGFDAFEVSQLIADFQIRHKAKINKHQVFMLNTLNDMIDVCHQGMQ